MNAEEGVIKSEERIREDVTKDMKFLVGLEE